MTRWKASAIHLALSILVLCTIAAVLMWRWYPPGLFHTVKADKLLFIIAAVDVVLGPLLTLVIYKQGKKRLKFDLAVIAFLQVGAMGYGLHTVWESRPVYLVGVIDRFQLVFANELNANDLKAAPPRFRKLPLTGVAIIGAALPEDGAGRMRILLSAMSGKDVHLIPERYVPYASVAKTLLARATLADDLLGNLLPDDARTMQKAIGKSGRNPSELVVVPVDSARGSASMLLDARDGRVIGPVAVDPWPAINSRENSQ
jgi:hypothetical protein